MPRSLSWSLWGFFDAISILILKKKKTPRLQLVLYWKSGCCGDRRDTIDAQSLNCRGIFLFAWIQLLAQSGLLFPGMLIVNINISRDIVNVLTTELIGMVCFCSEQTVLFSSGFGKAEWNGGCWKLQADMRFLNNLLGKRGCI